MKIIAVVVGASLLTLDGSALWACTKCRPAVESGVYNREFVPTLLLLMLPIAVLGVIGASAHFWDAIVARWRSRAGAGGDAQWHRIFNAGR